MRFPKAATAIQSAYSTPRNEAKTFLWDQTRCHVFTVVQLAKLAVGGVGCTRIYI